MVVCGVDYPVVKTVKSEKIGKEFPVLNIPMMSDQRWKELTNSPEQVRRRENLKKYGDPFKK